MKFGKNQSASKAYTKINIESVEEDNCEDKYDKDAKYMDIRNKIAKLEINSDRN